VITSTRPPRDQDSRHSKQNSASPSKVALFQFNPGGPPSNAEVLSPPPMIFRMLLGSIFPPRLFRRPLWKRRYFFRQLLGALEFPPEFSAAQFLKVSLLRLSSSFFSSDFCHRDVHRPAEPCYPGRRIIFPSPGVFPLIILSSKCT